MTRGKRNSQFEYRVTQTDRGVIIDFQGLSLFSRKEDLIQIVSLKCENKIAAKGSFPPETSSRTKFACSVNFGSLCEFEECNHDLGLPPSIIETEPSRILLKIYLRSKKKMKYITSIAHMRGNTSFRSIQDGWIAYLQFF